jgi:dTDP-4-amino-4,6-dideoxygalactose transaminase
MDLERVEAAITPRTRCLLPVHLYGLPVDMPELCLLARRHGLRIIEDCAHAHGATLGGRHVGTFGDIGCFSFYPTKNLGAYGDGGMCVTQDAALARRLRSLRMYGCDGDRIAQVDGRNSRLDELQAAILRVKLAHLPAALQARRNIADRYRDGLSRAACRLPAGRSGTEHAWHQFVIRCPDRARVQAAMQAHGVGYGVHYDPPLHLMPAFRRYHAEGSPLRITEQAAREVLSLPLYPGLQPEEIDRVVSAVRAGLHGEAAA